MKERIRVLAERCGFLIVDSCTVGVRPECDLKRLSAGDPIRTIFDVGAHEGRTAVRFARGFPGARVFAFEPIPETYDRLVARVARVKRVQAFPVALGEEEGVVGMGIAPDSGSNSILRARSAERTVRVKVATVDSISAENNVSDLDFLKIDVEGYEIRVLEGASALLREQKIRYVLAECVFAQDAEQPHTSFRKLFDYLDNFGFAFICCYTESFSLRDGVSMGNALFGCRSRLPAEAPGRVRNMV